MKIGSLVHFVALALLGAAACGNAEPAPAGSVASNSSAAPLPSDAPAGPLASADDPPAPKRPVPSRVFVGGASEHACFLSTDGALYCWGRNDAGQLGRKDDTTFYLPGRAAIDGRVVEASLGERHTCALLDTGEVRCVGEDASGPRSFAEPVGGLTHVAHLASGSDFACAATTDGAVSCFGRVPGGAARARDAARVEGLDARAIAASSRALCALTRSGEIACVGDNEGDSLVKGGPALLEKPALVEKLEGPLEAIAMADAGVCGLAKTSRVNCRGKGPRWDGTSFHATSQVAFAADGLGCSVQDSYIDCRDNVREGRNLRTIRGAFREVGVGRGFACALPRGEGPVVCWGSNAHGALGASPLRPRSAPMKIDRLQGATHIEAGDASVCGLHGHSIRCFGDHDRKESYGNRKLGDDSADAIVMVDGIAVGGGIRCGMTQGLASCWGDNRQSGVISENPGAIETPTTLASLGRLKSLSFGATHACATSEDGTIRCWGGAGRARKPAAEVRGFGDVHTLEAGGDDVCALLKDGGVSCAPFEGERALKPARVGGVRGLVALAVGGRHACGIDASGGVVCFGDNAHGQLGRDDHKAREAAKVEGIPLSKAVTAGAAFTCALGDDAKVRCWGDGAEGQLGRAATAGKPYAPVEGLDGVKAITAGEKHACALETDGDVHCWGDRRFGRFSSGDVESSEDPRYISLTRLAAP